MSAPVRVACPHCGAVLQLRSRDYLERSITCPGCRQSFQPQPDRAFDLLDVVEDDAELQGGDAPPASDLPSRPAPPRAAATRTAAPATTSVKPLPRLKAEPADAPRESRPPQARPGASRPGASRPGASRPAKPASNEPLDDEAEAERIFSGGPPSFRGKKKRRRAPTGLFKWLAFAVIVAVSTIALTQIPWSRFIPRGLALGDTPESLVNEVSTQLADIDRSLNQLSTGGNRAAVMADLQRCDDAIFDVYRRSIKQPLLSDAERQSLESTLAPALQTLNQRRQVAVVRLAGVGMGDVKVAAMVTNIELSTQGTVRVLTTGLQKLTPTNDHERAQEDFATIQKNALIAIAQVGSPADFATAGRELTALNLQLQTLVTRIETMNSGELPQYNSAKAKYSQKHVYLDNEIVLFDRLLMLKWGQYGDYQRAFVQFRQLRQSVEFAQLGQALRNPGDVAGGPRGGNPNWPPGFPPRPGGFPGPGDFPGPPGGFGAGPGGFPVGPGMGGRGMPKNIDEFSQEFFSEHGKENVVILYIPGTALPLNQQQDVTSQMQNMFGNFAGTRTMSGSSTGGTLFAYTLKGDLKQIAARIKFVKVVSVDPANRRITIDPPGFNPAAGFPGVPPS